MSETDADAARASVPADRCATAHPPAFHLRNRPPASGRTTHAPPPAADDPPRPKLTIPPVSRQ
ncbi:hypothetical protein B1M_41738 [Burkholderia sp. TJI49]|nr:hypothetical protein B1M_41738 [Burkholderia sp. TJI49]